TGTGSELSGPLSPLSLFSSSESSRPSLIVYLQSFPRSDGSGGSRGSALSQRCFGTSSSICWRSHLVEAWNLPQACATRSFAHTAHHPLPSPPATHRHQARRM